MQNVVDIHALSEDVKNFHLLNEWQAIYTFILYVRSTYLNNGMIVSIPPHKLNVSHEIQYIRTSLLHLLRQSVVKNQKNLQDNFCISLAHR